MKKILNALFLTIITLVTFSCSDVPAPYDINGGGNGEGPALTGDGTKENPYDIASAMAKQDNSEAWVMGYIVGNITDKDIKTESVFAPPFTNPANILIAADADETDYKKCIPVQLVGGTDVRTALNLKDNEGNLGKAVVIKGQLTKYFGVAGLKNPTAAVLDGKDIGDGGGTDPEPPTGTVLFEETFAASQGAFTINNVQLPEGSTFVWQWSAYNESGYMKASAFVNNQNKAAESWLISPSVDLTKSSDATLVFDHAYKFAADKTKDLTLWVTETGKDAWAQIAIPNYSDGASWTFVSSGNISLKDYVGKNIQFAFKYVSTTEAAGMWEVKNVKVVGDGDVPNPPVEGDKIFTETLGALVSATTAFADFQNWDNKDLTFSATGKVDIRAIAHRTEENKTEKDNKVNNIWFPANGDTEFSISKINAAGYKKFVLLYEAVSNVFDAGTSIDLNVLKVAFNGTELTVPSKIVSKDNNDANVFYEMQVDINIAGTANSTLKFFAAGTDNTKGLRLYNIRLLGVEKGGTDPEPSTNLLVNPSFETWTETNPDNWGRTSVTNVTYEKSAIAKTGTNAVLLKGNGKNARFGSSDITLAAGTYTLSVFSKRISAAETELRMGYVPIKDDGTPNSSSYKYLDPADKLTDDWEQYTHEFTLDAETKVSIFFASSKSNVAERDFLIDDISLTKK